MSKEKLIQSLSKLTFIRLPDSAYPEIDAAHAKAEQDAINAPFEEKFEAYNELRSMMNLPPSTPEHFKEVGWDFS